MKVDENQCLQDTVQKMDKIELIVLIRKRNDMLGRSPVRVLVSDTRPGSTLSLLALAVLPHPLHSYPSF
ncbi:hypothetical protein, partial [Klebsiella pneumoniae]|uniref:hypothetical protein n=1 Tax=Klebsiella pneumoniae TaxID=573 RepID=UPI0040554078